jgi:hypothetical protein
MDIVEIRFFDTSIVDDKTFKGEIRIFVISYRASEILIGSRDSPSPCHFNWQLTTRLCLYGLFPFHAEHVSGYYSTIGDGKNHIAAHRSKLSRGLRILPMALVLTWVQLSAVLDELCPPPA